jgi:hypothetical protein
VKVSLNKPNINIYIKIFTWLFLLSFEEEYYWDMAKTLTDVLKNDIRHNFCCQEAQEPMDIISIPTGKFVNG